MAITKLIYNKEKYTIKQVEPELFELCGYHTDGTYLSDTHGPRLKVGKCILNLKKISRNAYNLKGNVKLHKDELSDIKNDAIEKFNIRSKSNGKTAFIIPIFSFTGEDKYLLDNYNRTVESIGHDDCIFPIELAFWDNPFLIPDGFKLRGDERHIMWQKERLINLAAEQIPDSYENIAWVDSDILFESDTLMEDIDKALNVHSVVQLFSTVEQLTKTGKTHKKLPSCTLKYGGHRGYAWAMRREDFIEMGGLYDKQITGIGDCLLEHIWIPKQHTLIDEFLDLDQECGIDFSDYIEKSVLNVKSSTGCIYGNVKHQYHKPYTKKSYEIGVDILRRFEYDPANDIVLSDNNLWEWNLEIPKNKNLYVSLLKHFILK
jgi:hypothetical protein